MLDDVTGSKVRKGGSATKGARKDNVDGYGYGRITDPLARGAPAACEPVGCVRGSLAGRFKA